MGAVLEQALELARVTRFAARLSSIESVPGASAASQKVPFAAHRREFSDFDFARPISACSSR
jgi:hypothetical protein